MIELMVKVLQVFRKQKSDFHSIEKVYHSLDNYYNREIQIQRAYAVSEKISLLSMLRSFFFFKRIKADVIHITGEVYYLSLIFPCKKLIITIHDCAYVKRGNWLKRSIIKYLWLKLPVRRASKVIVISEWTKQEVMALTGCAEERIVTIPNPISPLFRDSPHLFNKMNPRILHVGTRWNKNLERVIEALEGIVCKLIIVGTLSENQVQKLQAAKIEYENFVDVSEDNLVTLYKEVDLVVFPSLLEGFGLPIVEAQASGRPVITSLLSPMKEVAGDGALLVDPYSVEDIRNGIKLIIEDDGKRLELIRAGLKNVERFRPSRIGSLYSEQYLEIFKLQQQNVH